MSKRSHRRVIGIARISKALGRENKPKSRRVKPVGEHPWRKSYKLEPKRR